MMKDNNKGYSLVELVIMMGIMAVLSALAGVTIHLIDSARYTAATNTIESELSTLRMMTMAKDSNMCLRFYCDNDGNYFIERGVSSDGTVANFRVPAQGDSDYDEYFSYNSSNKPIKVSNKITVQYKTSETLPSGAQSAVTYLMSAEAQKSVPATNVANASLKGVIIQFNKSDGSVRKGNGNINIIKKDGSKCAKIVLNQVSGSHTRE